jgi:sec-independent protein translocase protein TatA
MMALGPSGFGWQEGIVILAIVLVLFGAKKLPEIGRGLGKGIREFKDATKTGQDEEDESSQPPTPPDHRQG